MKNIDELLAAIEKSLYGINFEVKLGIDVFEGNSFLDFEKAVKQTYPNTRPIQLPPIEVKKQEFDTYILEKLNYRGDKTAGLNFSKKQEEKLQKLLGQYFDILASFQNNYTKYYYYTDLEGLSCYPVFWDFGFIIFTNTEKIILVYGAASD